MVRGTVVLPHGTGKTLRVLVVCEGPAQKQAEEAGADFVLTADEAVAKIQGGWLEIDAIVATPDMMRQPVEGRPGPRSARSDAEPEIGNGDTAVRPRSATSRPVRWSSGSTRRRSSTLRSAR